MQIIKHNKTKKICSNERERHRRRFIVLNVVSQFLFITIETETLISLHFCRGASYIMFTIDKMNI
jgi:hypothetical protein